jgi:Flp pilus assembly protein TadG
MVNLKLKILRNERGIVFPLFVVFLSTFLVMSVLIFDLSRLFLFRHELQSIVDSLSLAGASAKSVSPIYGSDPELGEIVTGYNSVIDPVLAQREAQSAMMFNRVAFEKDNKQNGKIITNWEGHVVDNNKFDVTVWGQMNTILYGKVMRLLGDTSNNYDQITIQVHSGGDQK